MLIDDSLLDGLEEQAVRSPRLRMNLNLHDSLEAKAQRLLNALEPGGDFGAKAPRKPMIISE